MTRTMLLLLGLLLRVGLGATPLTAAQAEVDIDAVSRSVLAAEPGALLIGLRTPMADEDLPPGFSGAELIDPEEAGAGGDDVVPAEAIKGLIGTVAYTLDYAPRAANAAETGATPGPGSSTPAIGVGSLDYVVLEDELTSDDLEDFKAGAEESLAQVTSSVDASVENITVNGTDAVLLTFVLEEGGRQSAVQRLAVPVGNVLVLSTVLVAAETVEATLLRADAEALVLSGVEHLRRVAAQAQELAVSTAPDEAGLTPDGPVPRLSSIHG